MARQVGVEPTCVQLSFQLVRSQREYNRFKHVNSVLPLRYTVYRYGGGGESRTLKALLRLDGFQDRCSRQSACSSVILCAIVVFRASQMLRL